jgi:dienelactone hydrolase
MILRAALLATLVSIAPAVEAPAESAVARATPAATEAAMRWHKDQLLIPAAVADITMITSVLRPSGRGPFPLAIINHGTIENDELRAAYSEPSFEVASAWLVEHGYAVALPQRPGHGETGGPYLESADGCEDARYEKSGYATADSIQAAAAYLLREPYVKKEPLLLVGHSAGAWGALALASRNTGMVAGVINFSGGRGGHSYGAPNNNCAPERLVNAAAYFGRTVRVPTLWLYSSNDSYFGPELSRHMAEAFRAAGGPADYRLLPPVEDDGHRLIYSREAMRHWGPIGEKFLAGLKSRADTR